MYQSNIITGMNTHFPYREEMCLKAEDLKKTWPWM